MIDKMVMIGAGFVGSTAVFSLMEAGLFKEIVMIDVDKSKAVGEAMDISHGIPFSKEMKIYAGDYEDIDDAGLIIISAGANQRIGETRLDLLNKNVEIFKDIIPKINSRNYNGLILVVTNPVDILTYVTCKLSVLPKNKILGSGTVLDTARLKYSLGKLLTINSKSVHAYIIGEHGDSEIAAFSNANISGIPIDDYLSNLGHSDDKKEEVAYEVKNSAYEIIKRKNATYFGIAIAIRRICEAIVRDEKAILPISVFLEEYDIVLSMPSVIGDEGVLKVLNIKLDQSEKAALHNTRLIFKEIISKLDI